jgi:hypothetical protein
MLEKIKSSLNDLESIYEIYADQKKVFRKKNSDKLRELENDPDSLNKVRDIIKAYDQATFLGQLWISLFWSVKYYRELVQYYDLNAFVQKINSVAFEESEQKDKLALFDEMLAFLKKFDVQTTSETISEIHENLLKIRGTFEEATNPDFDSNPHVNSDTDIFSVSMAVCEDQKSVPDVLPLLPDEMPTSLSDVRSYNTLIVNYMISLLRKMGEINWQAYVHNDEAEAYACYQDLIEKFEVALKQYNKLRIPAHPDKQNIDPSGSLFVALQDTYHTYKSYKEAIKSHVDQNGLASLNSHLPKEKERSVIDLLETLNAMLQAYIDNCDKHLALFKQALPEQEAELTFLTEEMELLSKTIERAKQADLELGEELDALNNRVAVQDSVLNRLSEESKTREAVLVQKSQKIAGLDKEVAEFDEKITRFKEEMRMLIRAQIKECMADEEGEGGVQAQKSNGLRIKSGQSTFFQAGSEHVNSGAPVCHKK